MKNFKPPKVIYLEEDDPSYGIWHSRKREYTLYQYIRIDKRWKKKFKEQFPMLASDDAGVIGFIDKLIN